jgi:hypothetical protein
MCVSKDGEGEDGEEGDLGLEGSPGRFCVDVAVDEEPESRKYDRGR